MATNGDAGSLSAVHHDGGIPTHPSTVGALDSLVAGEFRLILGADGVDVVGGWNQRHIELKFVAATKQ